MPAYAPRVLADPIGVVVDLVADTDSNLTRAAIEAAVASVAGGRAKRRRLAQALLDRPSVLIDGRSPAPRVVTDLLLVLREAGAVGISAPVCVECGKQLRTFHRRGEDWYCTACGPRPRRCASCGQDRIVATLDRQGQPRCSRCPDRDDRDPLLILTEVISTLEPGLPGDVVSAGIHRVFSKRGYLQHLAWVIEDRPDLLTGQGAHAPMPGVLRLIDELCDAGAQTITRPACPRCQRIIRLHRRLDGQWVCRNCVAKSRAQPCSRCGAIREAAARDEHGQPLCPNCLITDPANHETCLGCGRRRSVSVRTPDGPLCPTCRPVATLTCSICGRSAPAVISKATDKPWCHACRQRRARCIRCGNVRLIRGGTLTNPLCATCARPDPSFWHTCPGCGEPTAHRRLGRCSRCTLQHRLQQLLRGKSGTIHPKLQALHDHLAHHDRPETVLSWLNRDSASLILRELGAGQRPLTHAALDELSDSKPLQHLRSVLVATGALPPRDEHLIRLERWITATVAERDDLDERQLLHRYAVWHVLRRLRHRIRDTGTTYGQAVAARRNITAATTLLDQLTTRGLTLATARQGDLETWLTSTDTTSRDAGNFVRWTNKQQLTALDFPAVRWRGPTGIINTEARWEQARRLLHDDTLKPEDRAAGLLVLLYAQTAAAISRLTLNHVETSSTETRLQLGREPVVLPEPVDALVQQLVTTRRGHAALGDQGTSPWLFPGGQPGRPISAFRLAERLRQLGIQAGPSRSTALFGLATELPAALLARLLGIHISVAVAWQRASSGDWATYAADYSRRNQTPAEAAEPVARTRE